MNYIREMNAFIDWLETNPLEASTQTLWFHLMGIANKSGWPEWFTVANLTLQARVGVSENTLLKHRNFLIQKGRIEYRNQGKQKAGKYHFIEFTANNEVNHEVKYEVKREVNHEVKGAPLFKLNETKGLDRLIDDAAEIILPISSQSETDKAESFYSAHHRIYGFYCNQFQVEQLGAFIDKDGMEEAVIIRALERAATAKSAHNFKYILGILNGYLNSKAKTLAAAISVDEEFERGSSENDFKKSHAPPRSKGPSGKPQLPIFQDNSPPSKPRSSEYQAWSAALAKSLDGDPISYEELEALKEKARIADAEFTGETEGALNR